MNSVMTVLATSAHFTTSNLTAWGKNPLLNKLRLVLQLQNWRADLQPLGLSTSGKSTHRVHAYVQPFRDRCGKEAEQDRRRTEEDWQSWVYGDITGDMFSSFWVEGQWGTLALFECFLASTQLPFPPFCAETTSWDVTKIDATVRLRQG